MLEVPFADLLAQRERYAGPIEIVDRSSELACRVDHHLGGGQEAQLGADSTKVGLDLACLGLTGGRELVVDRFLKGIAGPGVAEHPGYRDCSRAEQHQD